MIVRLLPAVGLALAIGITPALAATRPAESGKMQGPVPKQFVAHVKGSHKNFSSKPKPKVKLPTGKSTKKNFMGKQ